MNNIEKSILIYGGGDATYVEIYQKLTALLPKSKIIEALDDADAARKIAYQKFNLVILDFSFVDGKTIIQQSQALPAEQRPDHFIILTEMYNAEPIFTKIKNLEYFTKPVDIARFEEKITAIFSSENSTPQPKAVVDVNFINPFITSTLNVFEVTGGTKAEKVGVALKSPNDASKGDISSIIAINSEIYVGSMAICFEENCFLSIVNKMLGETYTGINDENRDAAAELCNQIFGGAKKLLNELGHTITPAIPTIIVGKDHQIKHTARGPVIVVTFATESGNFSIEAVTQPKTSL